MKTYSHPNLQIVSAPNVPTWAASMEIILSGFFTINLKIKT
jgi:hypothetical protein